MLIIQLFYFHFQSANIPENLKKYNARQKSKVQSEKAFSFLIYGTT